MAVKAKKPKFVEHDETPSNITDHAFEPRGEWWSLCERCGLAMPAHAETTVNPDDHIASPSRIGYYSDDNPEELE